MGKLIKSDSTIYFVTVAFLGFGGIIDVFGGISYDFGGIIKLFGGIFTTKKDKA
ncbi:hypothetical protein [Lysinibacillus endophyticus]|uniref:hypothetical protein n=1 Tax=Ureibacillus endophyticus TaxID=1978490 RepID=UPI003136B9E3